MNKRETRSEKCGRFLAAIIGAIFDSVPKNSRAEYIANFRQEIETYSVQSRRKGSPRNEGCVMELGGYDAPDISDPVCLARIVKEEFHLHYQKQTTAREKDAFLRALKKY